MAAANVRKNISAHFVEGKPSMDPRSLSYASTIFHRPTAGGLRSLETETPIMKVQSVSSITFYQLIIFVSGNLISHPQLIQSACIWLATASLNVPPFCVSTEGTFFFFMSSRSFVTPCKPLYLLISCTDCYLLATTTAHTCCR